MARVIESYHGAKVVPDNDYAFMAQVVDLPTSRRRAFMAAAGEIMDDMKDN